MHHGLRYRRPGATGSIDQTFSRARAPIRGRGSVVMGGKKACYELARRLSSVRTRRRGIFFQRMGDGTIGVAMARGRAIAATPRATLIACSFRQCQSLREKSAYGADSRCARPMPIGAASSSAIGRRIRRSKKRKRA